MIFKLTTHRYKMTAQLCLLNACATYYVKKPLEMGCMTMLKMHMLLGDIKTPQTFTKEHIKVLHVINAHASVLMRMMGRGAR